MIDLAKLDANGIKRSNFNRLNTETGALTYDGRLGQVKGDVSAVNPCRIKHNEKWKYSSSSSSGSRIYALRYWPGGNL